MSFWRNYFHLTWATKNRLPIIQSEFERQLFSYMVKKASELDVFVYALNGTENHVHAVVSIPPKHSVSEVVKALKGASAHYVNHSIHPTEPFVWQRGYGCLTIGEKQRSLAEEYVGNQKKHHQEDTTIGWLEKQSDQEEGPSRTKTPFVERRNIGEEMADYNILGEFPF